MGRSCSHRGAIHCIHIDVFGVFFSHVLRVLNSEIEQPTISSRCKDEGLEVHQGCFGDFSRKCSKNLFFCMGWLNFGIICQWNYLLLLSQLLHISLWARSANFVSTLWLRFGGAADPYGGTSHKKIGPLCFLVAAVAPSKGRKTPFLEGRLIIKYLHMLAI